MGDGLIRGFLRGSKRFKKGKISIQSKEFNERRIYLKKKSNLSYELKLFVSKLF